MADKNVGVFGIYATQHAVEAATAALETAGFPTSDISVIGPEGRGILLAVHCVTTAEIARARDVVEHTGGEYVSSTREPATGSEDITREIAIVTGRIH